MQAGSICQHWHESYVGCLVHTVLHSSDRILSQRHDFPNVASISVEATTKSFAGLELVHSSEKNRSSNPLMGYEYWIFEKTTTPFDQKKSNRGYDFEIEVERYKKSTPPQPSIIQHNVGLSFFLFMKQSILSTSCMGNVWFSQSTEYNFESTWW